MTDDEHLHSRLLRDAARQFLSPLGVKQKGRSRTWLDDNGWWLCIVEFQPSGFTRGSYLNVGCMWLWREKDYFSFDEGYRVENFVGFKNPDQFATSAENMARRAATEVERYRSLFSNVSDVANHYMNSTSTEFWRSFHGAVACGAVGQHTVSRQLFEQVLRWREDLDWVKSVQAEAAALHSVLDNIEEFHRIVWDKVNRTRQLLKLSPQQPYALS